MKSCKKIGVILQELIPTQHPEKNCNSNQGIRGLQD